MADIYQRMAYRTAARAAFQQSEEERKHNNAPKQNRVYHAHGYVVRSENVTTCEETWTDTSAFSQVFFDFDKAKQYVLTQFKEHLVGIYVNDPLFDGTEIFDLKDLSWKLYIETFISYDLVISEIDPEHDAAKASFANPDQIDWHLRYNGEVQSRQYLVGNKFYEHRETDLLPESGKKFCRGDLVLYNDWENKHDYEEILVVLNSPIKPQNAETPWENLYEVVYVKNNQHLLSHGCVLRTKIHECDLNLCDSETLAKYPFAEQTLALQKVVKGGADISPQLAESVLGGKVLFNDKPSWRDYHVLLKKE